MLALLVVTLLLASPPADTSWEHQELREQMVRTQIESRDVSDPAVLRAMRTVPRHRFAPDHSPEETYADRPLPIGHGQTISQPYIVASMTERVRPDSTDRALEIGTGSGYQAAVLAEIVDSVYSIEIISELAASATRRLAELEYDNVETRHADGYHGWPEHGPFDLIVVTAAAEHIPPPLVRQLKEGGRMIIPVGNPFRTQMLTLVTKEDGETSTQSLAPVRFVPLRRADD